MFEFLHISLSLSLSRSLSLSLSLSRPLLDHCRVMVASKVKAAGAFRILDEANASRKVEGDYNAQGGECRGARCFASIAKPSRDSRGRVLLSRKSLPVNAPAKPNPGPQDDFENGKGKVQSRRKALADIGNLNNKTSQQFTNRLSYKPKLVSRRDILEGAKKVKVEENNMSQGLLLTKNIGASSNKALLRNPKSSALISGKISLPVRRRTIAEANISKENQTDQTTIGSKISKIKTGKIPQARFFVGTKKATKNAATTRRPSVAGSKVLQALITRKASNTNRFETIRHSWNKDLEEHDKSSNHDNAMVSQEHLKTDGSNCSNILMTSTSGCKTKRRKSYTLSLVIRNGCDSLLKKDLLPNIDDIANPLEVVEYVEDIYQYYWTMEVECPSLANYMEIQSEVTPKMRSILVNWLIEVHHKYQLMEETLFLMIELLNRLLSIVTIKKSQMQLFGLTALLLASKYEDYWHPKVDELISLSSLNQFTRDEMLAMERFVLKKLQFRLNIPTPYVFMLRFLKAAQSDKKLEDLAFYLIELCLVENESLKYKPSLLSASAIFVARSNLQLSPPWTKLLGKHAHYEESQLRTCAEMILRCQREACCKPVKYTYQKYLKPDRSCVASIKPIKMLPP